MLKKRGISGLRLRSAFVEKNHPEGEKRGVELEINNKLK
jgi:hypothetical protein